MQRQLTFGGGVSPRNTRLRGQSIIEYVLIIAVIGLVIVFAGPGVAGAIRNQFNLVGNTVNSGMTGGGAEGGGATGGGSAGADSSTVQAAVAKDAKDWTLDEQKAVAEDIAAKGEASPAYSKAKAAMDANTKWSIKLTNGETMTYRIIGIDHDDLVDGSGKAGLTFEATSSVSYSAINSSNKTLGGWEKSELRAKMNSGKIWNLMPSELQSKLEPVRKLTDNQGGGADPKTPTVTVDKLFLISATEVWGSSWAEHWNSFSHNGADVNPEGTQYEYYRDKGASMQNKAAAAFEASRWTRTISPYSNGYFVYVNAPGNDNGFWATSSQWTYPVFCF